MDCHGVVCVCKAQPVGFTKSENCDRLILLLVSVRFKTSSPSSAVAGTAAWAQSPHALQPLQFLWPFISPDRVLFFDNIKTKHNFDYSTRKNNAR